MQNTEIISLVQWVLADQGFMQIVFQNIYSYDNAIGIAFQWDYSILPKNIYPIGQDEAGNVYAMVTFDTTRNSISIGYAWVILFTQDQTSFQILYPGSSNTDYRLFNDIYGVAIGIVWEWSVLANTKIVGEIGSSGWKEEWEFILPDTTRVTKIFEFSTDPAGGTSWAMK